MFDIGFSELMVIGIVALIVIGPEKLPKVARTLGHLLGRAQRYVNDVKSDINREIQLDELKKLQSEVTESARSLEDSVRKEFESARAAVEVPAQAAVAELNDAAQQVAQSAAGPGCRCHGQASRMNDPQANPAHEESFISHLVELRDRLLRSLIAVAVVLAALAVYPGPGAIYDILAAPLTAALPEGTKMIAIGVITPFMVPLKVTAMVAFVLALPFVLYQVWAFIAPGLYAHEKRLGIPLIISSSLLFLLGIAFCYFFVFGQVFSFINSFAPKSITPAPDIDAYLSFVMTMFLAFGIAFEVPVALVVLVKLGVVTVDKLKEWRSYFIVGAFIVAAVVTPPDVVSQLALAIPMCLLYELGILAARFVSRTAPPEYVMVDPAEEAKMDAEMDSAEEEFRKLSGK